MDENEKNRLEREKLEIEKQKLDLERQKFEFEKSTTEEGYSVSSNPNLSSTGNSGLSSFFQKYKIAVILSLTILVITCTFYGIHHRGFSSNQVNIKGQKIYQRGELRGMLLDKQEDGVEEILGKPDWKGDNYVAAKLIYYQRTYESNSDNLDRECDVFLHQERHSTTSQRYNPITGSSTVSGYAYSGVCLVQDVTFKK